MCKNNLFKMLPIAFLSFWIFTACNSKQKTISQNEYRAVTWSPDGEQTAYLKLFSTIKKVEPRFSLFIAQEGSQTTVLERELAVCVNNRAGTDEQILFYIPLSENTERGLQLKIDWEEDALVFGRKEQDQEPEVWTLNLLDNTTRLTDRPFRSIDPMMTNNLEQQLTIGNGPFGYLGFRSIYLIDHRQKEVSIYLQDPLESEDPFIPTYK